MAFKMKGNPMKRNFGKHIPKYKTNIPGINNKSEGNTDKPDGRSASSAFQYHKKGHNEPTEDQLKESLDKGEYTAGPRKGDKIDDRDRIHLQDMLDDMQASPTKHWTQQKIRNRAGELVPLDTYYHDKYHGEGKHPDKPHKKDSPAKDIGDKIKDMPKGAKVGLGIAAGLGALALIRRKRKKKKEEEQEEMVNKMMPSPGKKSPAKHPGIDPPREVKAFTTTPPDTYGPKGHKHPHSGKRGSIKGIWHDESKDNFVSLKKFKEAGATKKSPAKDFEPHTGHPKVLHTHKVAVRKSKKEKQSPVKQKDKKDWKKQVKRGGEYAPITSAKTGKKTGETYSFTKGARTKTGTYGPEDKAAEKGKKKSYYKVGDTHMKTVEKKKKGATKSDKGPGMHEGWKAKKQKEISAKKYKKQVAKETKKVTKQYS